MSAALLFQFLTGADGSAKYGLLIAVHPGVLNVYGGILSAQQVATPPCISEMSLIHCHIFAAVYQINKSNLETMFVLTWHETQNLSCAL